MSKDGDSHVCISASTYPIQRAPGGSVPIREHAPTSRKAPFAGRAGDATAARREHERFVALRDTAKEARLGYWAEQEFEAVSSRFAIFAMVARLQPVAA